jgi:cysteinyl-tRNA synthetase
LREAEQRVVYIYATLGRLQQALSAMAGKGAGDGPLREPSMGELVTRFEQAMDDDFNTAQALGNISESFRLVNEILDRPGDPDVDARTLRRIHEQLVSIAGTLGVFHEDPAVVLARIEQRRQSAKGVDAAAINALIDERNAARKARDFKRADAIRDELAARGIVIKDSAAGTTWTVG